MSILRKYFLKIFKTINPGDITIKHHWTGDSFLLHSFRHKGYWYYGKNREKKTMIVFEKLIKNDFVVIEVGGHIGYISLFFSSLAKNGKVYVFEPGENNLPYTRKNLTNKVNIKLIEKGIGDKNETIPFYMEDLTGQNNSFVKDFDGYKNNKQEAGVQSIVTEKSIECITLDSFAEMEQMQKIDFIKIDIEGFEYNAILGMRNCIAKFTPIMMVEIQSNFNEIYNYFSGLNYIFLNEDREVCNTSNFANGNYFLLNKNVHATYIRDLEVNID
jgi:FkbM family methyltransferase